MTIEETDYVHDCTLSITNGQAKNVNSAGL